MGRTDKERQRDRYERECRKHHRSRDEQRQIDEHVRQRKARTSRRAPRAWDEDDSVAFEKIKRAERLRPDPAAASSADAAGDGVTEPGTPAGLVVWLGRGVARVELDGVVHEAVLSAELARHQQSAIAVGDRVECEVASDRELRVRVVAPRRSWLARPDPGIAGRERVFAANLDVAVLVVAARQPTLRPGLIDRFCIAVERGRVAPLICINKVDLLADAGDRTALEEQLAPYTDQGLAVCQVSASRGLGIDELRAQLAGCTCVFVGPSGVGKSSLLNCLDPMASRAVGAVRTADGKGRHTTTASCLVALGADTRCIDTPGVRAFGLGQVSAAELAAAFPEIAGAAAACRFRDCRHDREPECAVRDAVAAGGIARRRWESWQRVAAADG
ncbi:MAG: ribosome small subunit-dependent GTPase A [Planctomycetota bacterium]